MSDDEDDAVQDDRIDWLIERVEHRPLMFKQDRINKMKIHDESTCERPTPHEQTKQRQLVTQTRPH